ncbi:MAG TPA: DUF2027 domain-containing protein [Cytophagaceae bacterium]
MKIGDKVRLLRGKEEGILKRIIDQKQVEIEIEDGFRIPVLRSEIVVVSSEENRLVSSRESNYVEVITSTKEDTSKGIYLAFVPFNDKILTVHLINQTDYQLLLTFGEEDKNGYKGVYSGTIKSHSEESIHQVNVTEFESWPTFVIQAIYFRNGTSSLFPPLFKKNKFKASSFFKSSQVAPVINKSAYLYQIDKDQIKVDADQLLNKVEANKTQPEVILLERPEPEIDLHIEQLTKDHLTMNASEMLELQLRTFEIALEKAIATGMEDITFIHGAGSGILRNEIQKRLSANKNIRFFKDAKKEKFGYGATFVQIK